MRCVGGAAHRQEQHIFPGGLLESQRHGDAAALARQIGLHVPDTLDCLAGGGEVPVSRVGNPPFAGVLQGAGDFILRAERRRNFLDVSEDSVIDGDEIHVWNGPDAEFADHFGGDDGLGAGGGEGALDAVEGEGREPPASHEGAFFAVRVYGGLVAEGFV